MNPSLRPWLLGLIAAVFFSTANAVIGQTPEGVRSPYDRGVRAYLAGRSAEAEGLLSEAMGEDPNDPRPYYFRALSLLRQGRVDEARGDMLLGASLESQRPNGYGIGTALERVQGCDRLMLEKYRREGRAASSTARAQLNRDRQHRISVQDSEVLRETVVIPLDELFRPEGPRALSAQELARRAAAAAAAEAEAAGTRAPGRSTMPIAQPPVEDPFREDAATPSAEAPAEPEGTAPAEEEPAVDEPAEDADPGEDPFGTLN